MANIILAAGGTGGHIFPALAVGEVFAKAGHHVTLFTDKRGAPMVEGKISYKVIQASSPFKKGPFAKALGLASLSLGILQSLFSLAVSRPHTVIGFGGYPSFPPLLASHLLRVPVILHEQNAVMGRANQWLAKFAHIVALSFEKTKGASHSDKTVTTGMPVRDAFYQASEYKARASCHLTIIGGSLGAQIFADLLPEALALLPDEVRQIISITHQARDEHISALKQRYQEMGIRADVARFYHDMARLYDESDIIISRAGASSVAEISASGRASILIPFAGALDDHQTGNALRLVEAKGAFMISEQEADAASLARYLTMLIDDETTRVDMAHHAKSLAHHSAAAAIAALTDIALHEPPSQMGEQS